MLAHGQVPLSQVRLWGRGDVEGTGRPIAALVDMIAMGRRQDPALKGKPPPDQWPMAALWPTPEGVVLEIVELHALLRADGLTDREAIEKIEAWRTAIAVAHDPPPPDLEAYVKFRASARSAGLPGREREASHEGDRTGERVCWGGTEQDYSGAQATRRLAGEEDSAHQSRLGWY